MRRRLLPIVDAEAALERLGDELAVGRGQSGFASQVDLRWAVPVHAIEYA